MDASNYMVLMTLKCRYTQNILVSLSSYKLGPLPYLRQTDTIQGSVDIAYTLRAITQLCGPRTVIDVTN